MERRPALILRADEILARRTAYAQRLNPRSGFQGTSLATIAGLTRTGVSMAWLPPGGESFAYHAHRFTEEWIYILSGRAVAEVDGQEIEVGPGDFIAFPAPQVAHLLVNRSAEEVVYLMGGERRSPQPDLVDYPHLGKTYLLVPGSGATAFYELGAPIHPFGPIDREEG
jgi:uncharacterized cupin superfamily protein